MTPAPVYRGLLVPSRILGLSPAGFLLSLALAGQLAFLTGEFMAVMVLAGIGSVLLMIASRSRPDPLESLRAALRHRQDYRI